MRAGATPEELEMLLEDAAILQDGAAMSCLFEPDALLVLGGESFCGQARIAQAATLLSRDTNTVLAHRAQTRRVYQAQDLVLLLGDNMTSVARRAPDGDWKFAIALIETGAAVVDRTADYGRVSRRKDGTMHTMVVRMSTDPARRDEVRAHFEQDVVGWAKRQAGFVSGQWLCNTTGDQALGIVVFESAEAADNAAQSPRDYGRHAHDASRAWNIEDVTVYEQVERA